VYILENTPGDDGGYRAIIFGGGNVKGRREKKEMSKKM
jgi:hypothetical protein